MTILQDTDFVTSGFSMNIPETSVEIAAGKLRKFADGYMKVATESYKAFVKLRLNIMSTKSFKDYVNARRKCISDSVERAISSGINIAMLNAEIYSAAAFLTRNTAKPPVQTG